MGLTIALWLLPTFIPAESPLRDKLPVFQATFSVTQFITAIIAFVVLNIIFCTDLNCIGRIPFLGIIAEEDVFRPFSIILAVTTIALALSVCGSLSECRKSKRASAIKKKNTIGLVLSLAPIVALVIIYLC